MNLRAALQSDNIDSAGDVLSAELYGIIPGLMVSVGQGSDFSSI